MSELRFKTQFHSFELQSLALPVEVRAGNLALVTRTLSTAVLTNIAPGTYHVTATLPAGQQLYDQVNVGEGEAATAVLQPDPADASPSESLEVQRFIVGYEPELAMTSQELEHRGVDKLTAKLRVFSGNVLQGALQLEESDLLRLLPAPAPGIAQFFYNGGLPKVVQLLQPETQAINIALPISPERGCHVILTQRPDRRLGIEVRLSNLEADSILRYYERGALDQAALMTTPQDFEALLQDKVRDPIGAAVGAYMLLRIGELNRLHNWTENLKNWFPWMPDGIPIRAEHLARQGDHQRALQTLIDLPARGLPMFSDGLSYALSRLRLYTSVKDDRFSEQTLIVAQDTLLKLQIFEAVVDFSRPLLTYTGVEPTTPDSEQIVESIENYDGLNVSPYMG